MPSFLLLRTEPLTTRYLAGTKSVFQNRSFRVFRSVGMRFDVLTPLLPESIVKLRWLKPAAHRGWPMNLPNSLTLLRIFFVPVLIVILLTRSPTVELLGYTMHFEVWGVLILLLAAATDWADGRSAERRV